MDVLIEWLVAIFVVVGGIFALIGSIGLARLPDFYTRLHGPTKATTLGVGGTIIASLLFFSDVTLAAGYRYFLTVLLACDLLSLRWDIPDTVKWLRNRRTVHGP